MKEMAKQLLSLALALAMVLGMFPAIATDTSAAAITGTCGTSINWSLEDGVLTLTGTGATNKYTASPFITYKDSVTSVVIGEGITRIEEYLFYQMDGIESVTLPSTLQAITNRAFAYCTALKEITIPESIATIGAYAFLNSGLTDVYFESATPPKTVSATSPFGGCSYMVHVPCNATAWTTGTIANWGGSSKTLSREHNVIDSVCKYCGEAFYDASAIISHLQSQIAALGEAATNDAKTELFMENSADGTIHLKTDGTPYIVTLDVGEVMLADVDSTYVSRIPAKVWEQMREIGQTYIDNRDKLAYGNSFTAWNETTTNVIDCSSFLQLVLSGVSYANSRYATGASKNYSTYYFGLDLPDNPYRTEYGPNRYLANDLAQYAMENGYAFYANEDFSNVQPGDVVFYWADTAKEDYYESITHCAFFVETVDDSTIKVLHGNDVDIASYGTKGTSTVKMVARLPLSDETLTGTCGASIGWTLADGVLTLTGTGATTKFVRTAATDTVNTPWWEYKDTVTKIVVGEGITNLENYVFYGCTNVTEVKLPTTLERIETRIFKDFTKLTELTVNSNLVWLGLEAFVGSGITDLYFTGDAPVRFSGTKPCTGLTYNIHIPCNNETWTDDKLTAMGGTPTKVITHAWVQGEHYEECDNCDAVKGVPVTGIALDKNTLTLSTGSNATLTAAITPSNATVQTVVWTSSDPTVAAVVNGVVTGLKAGTVTITAASAENSSLTAICTVTVEQNTSGACGENVNWTLKDGVLTLTGTGATTEFTRNSATDTVNTPWWEDRSSITKIVAGEGITNLDNYVFYGCTNVTEVKLPTTLERIETRIFKDFTKLTELTVNSNLVWLGLEAFVGSGITDLYFTGDAPVRFSGTKPCTGLTYNIHIPCNNETWTDDKLTAMGGTPTLIKDHNWSGNKCSGCGAKANNPVTAIRLDAKKATVYVNSTYAINAAVTPADATDKSLKWTSSNEQIAIVSSFGVVTGLKAGTVTITATAKDGSGMKATCTVTVKEGYGGSCGISAYWSFEKGVLTITGTGDLTIFTRNAQTDEVNYPWAEIKDKITKVVIGEGITSLKNYAFYKCSSIAAVTLPSTLNIIAYGAFQGNTSLKKITIPAAVKEFGSQVFKDSGLKEITFLGLPPTSYGSNLFAGATLTAKHRCSDLPAAYGKNLTWVLYHNMKEVDGITRCADCGMIEGNQITGITLDVTDLQLTVGQSVTLNAVITPADAAYTVLEWISSETAVVTVTADGVVTAVDPGSANIIVRAMDGSGIEAICKVSVREKGYTDPQKPDDNKQPDTTPNDQQQDNENSNSWILWTLLGGIAVVGTILALLLGKKKKTRVNNQTDTK